MERKLCAGCGHPNMLTDTTCWACGGARFVAEGAPPVVDDRTLTVPHMHDRTMAWDAPDRHAAGAWYWVAGALSFAFFACGLGYWVGRASAPAPTPAVTPPAQAARAVAQPAVRMPDLQPTPLTVVPSSSYATAPAGGSTGSPASVSIRPIPARAPDRQPIREAAPGVPAGVPPYPGAIGAPAATPPLPVRAAAPVIQPRIAAVRPVRTVPDAPPEMDAPALAPVRGSAVVTLRNDTQAAVSITLDGNGSRTASIAPGTAYPLTLPPGTYHLRASGGGLESAGSTLALAPDRSYSLVVSRTGRDSLSLIEPALNGG